MYIINCKKAQPLSFDTDHFKRKGLCILVYIPVTYLEKYCIVAPIHTNFLLVTVLKSTNLVHRLKIPFRFVKE